jgi:hypothetical protein
VRRGPSGPFCALGSKDQRMPQYAGGSSSQASNLNGGM